jgi:hypothetical protein
LTFRKMTHYLTIPFIVFIRRNPASMARAVRTPV